MFQIALTRGASFCYSWVCRRSRVFRRDGVSASTLHLFTNFFTTIREGRFFQPVTSLFRIDRVLCFK